MGLVFLLLPLALANVRGGQTIVLLSFMKEPNLDNFFSFSQGKVHLGVFFANMKILVLGAITRCQMVPRYQLLTIDELYHLETRKS